MSVVPLGPEKPGPVSSALLHGHVGGDILMICSGRFVLGQVGFWPAHAPNPCEACLLQVYSVL